MSLTELLPTIHALPRVDKLRLMQVLVTDIAQEEIGELAADQTPQVIWSPFDAYDAAAVLLDTLNADQKVRV
jgi:hypothetical protein